LCSVPPQLSSKIALAQCILHKKLHHLLLPNAMYHLPNAMYQFELYNDACQRWYCDQSTGPQTHDDAAFIDPLVSAHSTHAIGDDAWSVGVRSKAYLLGDILDRI
jgi:hypothetical protein